MKGTYISLLLILTLSCSSTQKHFWALDNENDLTQIQIDKLDSLFNSHEKKTTNEIALVTTPDYGRDSSILLFAINFGRKYGIGKKGKDNGVVIVFSSSKRETRISTGYGTEKVLKDELAKNIIDSLMIPYFKQGKNFEGLWEGSKAVVDFLERQENKIK